ncbi:MAG: hypothetical protein AB1454_15100, partial [Candidatus Auribacterota bacterium]
ATGADAKFSDPQEGTGVVFDRLTAKANIKVYNIAGELVAELDEPDDDGLADGRYLWDTKNEDGDKVASGIYIYYITNPDNTNMKPARGKFAIIR